MRLRVGERGAQICYHVYGLRHSPKFCFPYMLYQGDDDFTPMFTHASTPVPSSPDKYPTMHAALRDTCYSPFELPDGRLITFCGPHIPDMKAGFYLSGLGTGPKSDFTLMDKATNVVRGVKPPALSFVGRR
jgi:hypothetical protein